MQLETFIGSYSSNIPFTASRETGISLTIILPGRNLPVRIRCIRVLSIDQEMDEVFLGCPLLKTLKFYLGNHLEQVRDPVHNKKFDDLGTTDSSFSSAKYTGISYHSADDYPVEFPKVIATGFFRDTPE